jgi:anti-sigma regulatory factor (Ser/Thr protein kinase)
MVTGTAVRAMTTIPGCERSVAEARSFVDGALGQAHPGRETARLLVSELVTNAIQHSDSRRPGGSVTVTVASVPGGIQIEVADEGSFRSVPVVRDDPLGADGRGLFLVQSLSDNWGYLRDSCGTTVWFRLAGLSRRQVARPRPAPPGRCAPGLPRP